MFTNNIQLISAQWLRNTLEETREHGSQAEFYGWKQLKNFGNY